MEMTNIYPNKKIISTLKWLLLLLGGIMLTHCKHVDAFKQGKQLYQNNCASCHMDDGTGLAALIPPLAKSDFYQKNLKTIPCIIRNGLSDTILVNGVQFSEKMEEFKKMSPESMTNVINYINHSWGNNLPDITLKDVRLALENCQ